MPSLRGPWSWGQSVFSSAQRKAGDRRQQARKRTAVVRSGCMDLVDRFQAGVRKRAISLVAAFVITYTKLKCGFQFSFNCRQTVSGLPFDFFGFGGIF
jgi:hypothetical protein